MLGCDVQDVISGTPLLLIHIILQLIVIAPYMKQVLVLELQIINPHR